MTFYFGKNKPLFIWRAQWKNDLTLFWYTFYSQNKTEQSGENWIEIFKFLVLVFCFLFWSITRLIFFLFVFHFVNQNLFSPDCLVWIFLSEKYHYSFFLMDIFGLSIPWGLHMWRHQPKAVTWVHLKIWIFPHFFTVYILNNVFCKFQVIQAENDFGISNFPLCCLKYNFWHKPI